MPRTLSKVAAEQRPNIATVGRAWSLAVGLMPFVFLTVIPGREFVKTSEPGISQHGGLFTCRKIPGSLAAKAARVPE
ncbi:MAG TPA: hypothetical protein VGC77_16570 [Rhodopseudomonas sp.]|uniref:hypothetical protein n=1 Tax=Rhodopseudomonas sp. TaxID=1078 RepID=UPI002ED7FEF2